MTVSRSDLAFFKQLDREAVAWRDKPPESEAVTDEKGNTEETEGTGLQKKIEPHIFPA